MTTAIKPVLTVPEGHLEAITCLAFSHDGQYILTGSADTTAKIWNLKSQMLRTVKGFEQPVQSLAFSKSNERYAVGSAEKTMVYEAESGDWLQTYEQGGIVAFHPEAEQIVVANGGVGISFFNFNSAEPVLTINHTSEKGIRNMTFSPNGDLLATSDEEANTFLIWDSTTGEKVVEVPLGEEVIQSLAFSKKGNILGVGTDKNLLTWEVERKKIINRKKVSCLNIAFFGSEILVITKDRMLWHYESDTLLPAGKKTELNQNWDKAVFSGVGSKLALWFSKAEHKDIPFADIWDIKTNRHQIKLKGNAHLIVASILSRDDSILAVATERTLKVWQLCANQPVQNIEVPANLETLDITDKGDKLIGGMEGGFMQLWNSRSCQPFCEAYKGNNKNINQIKFAGDGSVAIAGFKNAYLGKDDFAVILEGNKGKMLQALVCRDNAGFANAVDLSADGSRALTGMNDGTVRLWDTKTGRQILPSMEGHEGGAYAVALSTDKEGGRILAGAADGMLRLWDASTGEPVGKAMTDEAFAGKKIQAVVFSPNNDVYISSNVEDRNFGVWDAGTHQLLHLLDGHVYGCDLFKTCISFSSNGTKLFTSAGDTRVVIWDVHSGQELAHLYVLDENDWAVIMKSGLFDASPGGMKRLYYVVGLETIELEQLKERYYEPGLLARLIGVQKGELPDVSNLDKVDLFPQVLAAINDNKLFIRLKERNGGIGKVSVFVNNREVLVDANEERQHNLPVIDLSRPEFARLYPPGSDPAIIGIRSYNEEGLLKSSMHELEYFPDFVLSRSSGGTARLRRRKKRVRRQDLGMYAVFIGTSNYKLNSLSLTFPDSDANSMHRAIKAVGSKLFKDKIETHLLSTDPEQTSSIPTKENIKKLIMEIADKAKPTDTLLLYLSGHGITRKDKFYYLTRDMPSDELSDPVIREKFAISSEELTEWFKSVSTGRQVLIVDACDSGSIVDSFQVKKKSLNTDQIKALDRMKDRTGMFILTGSAGDKESFESSRFGQGLLTYSLLLGMSGAALREGEDANFVDVMELFQFSLDEVPKLARQIDREQQPQVIGEASFDIGIVDEEVDIPLPVAKPVFIRSAFMLNDFFNDPLDLSDTFDDYCRGITDEVPVLDVIFFDVAKFEDGYSVRGVYDINGTEISVECRLFKDNKAIGEKAKVSGKVDNVTLLADEIMRAVKDWVK